MALNSVRKKFALAGVLVLVLALGLVAGWWWGARPFLPQVTEEQVREAVVTTLQREAPASFLVTGTLEMTATTSLSSTKVFLPDVLDFSLGTTETTVRLPGRASYGFDLRQLEASDIRLREEGVVEVRLPELSVFALEPHLSEMEARTEVGWARLYRRSGRRLERQAIETAERALREQVEAHLEDSAQPRLHTAEALETMLRPVLEAAGLEAPRFRFQIGPTLVMSDE